MLRKNLTLSSIRNRGILENVIANYLDRPLPKKLTEIKAILIMGVAQILFTRTEDYAAVNTTVNFFEGRLKKWRGLSNAILRKIIREENYKNGKLEGQTTLYYPDGNVLEKSTYVADKKDGKSLQYYRNGQLKLSANYKADKLEGSYTLYNSAGVKKYSGNYLNDIKDGIWKYYKDDKSFDYQIEYINGISQGRQDG